MGVRDLYGATSMVEFRVLALGCMIYYLEGALINVTNPNFEPLTLWRFYLIVCVRMFVILTFV
jgi:hypothetical protein